LGVPHRGTECPPIVDSRRASIHAAGQLGYRAKVGLVQLRDRDPPDVIAMELLGRLGAVGRHRPTVHRPDAQREHRDPFAAKRGGRGLEVHLVALPVAHQQDRPRAPLALVLEHLAGRGQRGADVGRRVAQVIGRGGVEEQLERRVVGGRR
jgi:hypothetical protein